ncbi:MAG: hypothetical protein GY714_02970 [Desulfobacterales bacterium]|nr:hypothetical protein [Desulfobacterales bacterium]MCP4159716.1 hypothetical protein [Deltaproteobacteria bacterium]
MFKKISLIKSIDEIELNGKEVILIYLGSYQNRTEYNIRVNDISINDGKFKGTVKDLGLYSVVGDLKIGDIVTFKEDNIFEIE